MLSSTMLGVLECWCEAVEFEGGGLDADSVDEPLGVLLW